MGVKLVSSSGGSVEVNPPTTASNFTQTLVATTGTLAPIVSGTAVASTSGTSIDFTGIPSWVKRITVMFSGVSTNSTSNILIQLGSGSITTSGYTSTAASTYSAGTGIVTSTAGLICTSEIVAAGVLFGNVIICLQNSSNAFTSSSVLSGNSRMQYASGGVTLSGTLDRVRITTVNGTDTFDAGSINILYE
jgi:hypothetical protein